MINIPFNDKNITNTLVGLTSTTKICKMLTATNKTRLKRALERTQHH